MLGSDEVSRIGVTGLEEIPLEWIKPGRYQPRQEFAEEALDELARSIERQGVIQPIVLRMIKEHSYEIIAGERRWRAAQRVGLEKIPAVIKQADDETAMAMSLIENVQREDLNPVEQARALQRLASQFGLTHQQIADVLGKSRTAVTNSLRLNGLCQAVTALLSKGSIEMGHARALLTLPDDRQESVARDVVKKGLSVRQTEALVRKLDTVSQPAARTVDADTRLLQSRLSAKFGQPVVIEHTRKGQGRLIISYGSLDELDGILQQFGELD